MMGMSEIYQISRYVDPAWFEFLNSREKMKRSFSAGGIHFQPLL